MNTKSKFTAGLAIAAIACSASSFGVTVGAGSNTTTDIAFVNADDFADIRTSRISNDKSQQRVLDTIRETFVKSASKRLPDGYRLEVQVRDVDLAGDQSEMTSTFGDYRVMRDIYPPRISFDYVVKDAGENVVASGSESLTDLHYLNNLRTNSITSDDRGAFVKELVRDWVSRDLRRELQR